MKEENKSRADRFNYEVFLAPLEAFVHESGGPKTLRVFCKLKFMVLAAAWADFDLWADDVDASQAMAWAWEDMLIAFSGYGDSTMTGVVIDLWTSLPQESWPEFRRTLNAAKLAADNATANTVARRYLTTYRRRSVRTPEEGFDLPTIVPTSGPVFRDWAEAMNLDPLAAEEHMLAIEASERMGLLDFSETTTLISSSGEESHLSADVDGTKEEEEEKGATVLSFPPPCP